MKNDNPLLVSPDAIFPVPGCYQISKTVSDDLYVLTWFQQPFPVFDGHSGKMQFKIILKRYNLIVFSAYSNSVKSEGRA